MSNMNLRYLPSLLMTSWLTDFFSNLDSGLDSVPGLRKIAAAAVVHLFMLYFLFLLFICDHTCPFLFQLWLQVHS